MLLPKGRTDADTSSSLGIAVLGSAVSEDCGGNRSSSPSRLPLDGADDHARPTRRLLGADCLLPDRPCSRRHGSPGISATHSPAISKTAYCLPWPRRRGFVVPLPDNVLQKEPKPFPLQVSFRTLCAPGVPRLTPAPRALLASILYPRRYRRCFGARCCSRAFVLNWPDRLVGSA